MASANLRIFSSSLHSSKCYANLAPLSRSKPDNRLATLSYHFLEKPFRAGKYSISSLILLGVGLLFISINTNQIASLGWNPRSPKFSSLVEDIARNDYGANVRNESGYFFGAPNNSPPHLILFGNSHARMLIPNLSNNYIPKICAVFIHIKNQDMNYSN